MQPTTFSSHSTHWRRRLGDWHLVDAGRTVAILERTYDGWYCYADIDGDQRLVGVAGRIRAGKRLLAQVCASRRTAYPIIADGEAPL